MDWKSLTAIEWIKLIAIILGVVAFGMLAVNQTLGFYYKSELLQKPCDLCISLNPEFKECFIERTNVYEQKNNNNLEINLSNINFG